MPNSVCEVLITENRLERPADEADSDNGAVVDFYGVVRGLEDGRKIDGIDYEAHLDMAKHQLQQIAAAAGERFTLRKICVHHRIVFVRAGEASLFLQVRAAHRGPAFDASKWIMDELKKRVPIWKKPRFASRPRTPARRVEKPIAVL